MSNKSVSIKEAADKLVKNIRRKTARKYSAEEKNMDMTQCPTTGAAVFISKAVMNSSTKKARRP